MIVRKCDMCGKEYEQSKGIRSEFEPIKSDNDEVVGNFVTGIAVLHNELLKNGATIWGGFRTIDLCDDCLKKIMNVLEGENHDE